MKFGFESEKLLYDLKDDSIFHGVFHLVDALSDYASRHGEDIPRRVTNEFVLNMVEMNSRAFESPREVMADYLLLHQIVTDVALREKVVPLPVAAVPFAFTPAMVPRWSYYVQNCILSGRRLRDWALAPTSPLSDAGNCAGLHAHFEIGTSPEFLVFSRELVNKHNMGLMLTPMIAFSASPYFLGDNQAQSMRAHRYYFGVYEKHPLNGGLPPVMHTSEEVLRYTLSGIEHWIETGVRVGFSREDMQKIVAKKGANWSMIRWNKAWNTIELRCLESDRVDYDIAKFAWVAGAMKRLDVGPGGEALEPDPLVGKLDERMIDEAFAVSGKQVAILPTAAIHELTLRAVREGVRDPLVERYLHRMADFSERGLDDDCRRIHAILRRVLEKHATTSELMLKATHGAKHVTREQCVPILRELLQQERLHLQQLRTEFPEVIARRRSELFSGAA